MDRRITFPELCSSFAGRYEEKGPIPICGFCREERIEKYVLLTQIKSGQHMHCFNIKNMRRIIEPLSGYHICGDIRCKTIKFYKKLKLSPKPAVQCLLGICSKDKSYITGSNIDALMSITTESDFTSVKRSITLSLRPVLN